MQAAETRIQQLIEGTKQYLVPLFQRAYSWDQKEWQTLWKDLVELCEEGNPRPHFMRFRSNFTDIFSSRRGFKISGHRWPTTAYHHIHRFSTSPGCGKSFRKARTSR